MNAGLKRTVDVLGAAFGLLLLSPLMLVIAARIKLDTPGPVFFRQQRVGRGGALFRIHKFRSMAVSEAKGAPLTVGDDPRITRAGAWLRRSKLDELSQLIDVLHGDMSLVGPRPEVPEYVALYPSAVRDKVLSVRPGLTDLASIEFRRESELLARAADPQQAYVEQVLPEKLRLAIVYVDTATLWGDVKIIARTLAVLAGDAAPRAQRTEPRS